MQGSERSRQADFLLAIQRVVSLSPQDDRAAPGADASRLLEHAEGDESIVHRRRCHSAVVNRPLAAVLPAESRFRISRSAGDPDDCENQGHRASF